MHKQLKPGPLETTCENTRLASHALDRVLQFMTEMGHIEAAEVSEFNPLQIRPDALVRIQFRGVGR
jgi:hypothetical protein